MTGRKATRRSPVPSVPPRLIPSIPENHHLLLISLYESATVYRPDGLTGSSPDSAEQIPVQTSVGHLKASAYGKTHLRHPASGTARRPGQTTKLERIHRLTPEVTDTDRTELSFVMESCGTPQSGPLITIGVSTYNRKDYLRESLQSLQRQTLQDFEIIVVDDGSTDDTREMVRTEFPEVRYIYQPNSGDAAAKNQAAAHAAGRYLVFNDSDDLFLPDALERLYAPLAAHPDNCSYGQYLTIDAAGKQLPTRSKMKQFPSGNIVPELIMHVIVHSCATMMPTALFRALGGYDTTLRVGHDYKLALELATRTHLHAIPEPVFLRRRHSTNLSSANYEKIELLLNVVEDFLKRHPEAGTAYAPLVRKRLADFHNKLAREAKKEKRAPALIRQHLRQSLREEFSLKALLRYLAAWL